MTIEEAANEGRVFGNPRKLNAGEVRQLVSPSALQLPQLVTTMRLEARGSSPLELFYVD